MDDERQPVTTRADDELYARGIATALAAWERFAAVAEGAEVLRLDGVTAAVFPRGAEREVYNNAVLDRGLTDGGHDRALDAMEAAYTDVGVGRFAAWVHEDDHRACAALRDRGYAVTETTRAMARRLDDGWPAGPAIATPRGTWPDHVALIDLRRGFLDGIDATQFHVLVADHDGRPAATALAFDHRGDCGIYNVSTRPSARRRGLATALTVRQLRDARARGCVTASLQATPAAEALYAAAGFADLGRILEWGPPAGRPRP